MARRLGEQEGRMYGRYTHPYLPEEIEDSLARHLGAPSIHDVPADIVAPYTDGFLAATRYAR